MKVFGIVDTATAATASIVSLPTRPSIPQPALSQTLGPIVPITFQDKSPIALANSSLCRYLRQFLESLACPVTNEETGKAMEYRELRQHPKLKHIWETSYANEMGRLCQGIDRGEKGPKWQWVAGTETFRAI